MKISHLKFILLLICLSCIFRSISWTNNYLNIDELSWVYLTNRIKFNALPFSGFTAQTTGPLAIYLLSVINLFSEIPTLIGLRIFQFFICVVPTYFLVYFSLPKSSSIIGVIFFFFLIISPLSYNSLQGSNNDFLAYNTEYQIMLFMALVYFLQTSLKPTNFRILLIVFFCFCLFFLKSQSVLYTPYFLGLYTIQLYIYQRKSLLFFGLIIISFIILILSIFLIFGIFDDFLFEYIYKNFLYSNLESFKILRQLQQIKKVWFDILIFYWIVLFLLLIPFIYLVIKRKSNQFYSLNIFKSALLFLFSLGIIFISVFNFDHYKVLLFWPMTIFVAEIYDGLPKLNFLSTKPMLIFLTFGFLFTYRSVVIEVLKTIKNNNFEQYQSRIGLSGFEKTKFLNSRNNLGLYDIEKGNSNLFITEKLMENPHQNKVYIFGWFQALEYYFNHIKEIRLISKSSQTQYLLDWYLTSDFDNFFKEESKLMDELLKEKPDWIVDPEGVLNILKKERLYKFIRKNYVVAYQTKNIIIFKLNKDYKKR